MTTDPLPSSPMRPAAGARAPLQHAEQLRLEALQDYGILDTPQEAAFDDITRLAAMICQAPMALISLVDRERQWFKSAVGLGVTETPIGSSICAHAILQPGVLVVPDTLSDRRFSVNPLVTGDPYLRFYAGASLMTPDGLPLGTVCVLDTQPRGLRPDQAEALQALARQAMAQMELRRLLARAQQSSTYRRQLMAIAGHDLKTPIRTAAYAIRKVQRSLAPELGQPLDTASEALARIDREFTQLAAMAGTEGDVARPDVSAFGLSEVLEPVLANWRQAAMAKGIALRHVPARLHVQSNPALLATLLGNLIGNAIKYTARGKVLVGCRRHGDRVVVHILDTGLGMDEAHADELFSPFRQADPRSEGLGLGLWIVRSTAESLGHPLRMRSTPGQGSCFSIELPKA